MSKFRKSEKKSAVVGTTKASDESPRQKRQTSKKSPKSAIRSFVFSPSFNVVALVILLVAVYGGMRLFSANRTAAQIAFVERAAFDAPETANAENLNYAAPEIFRGEVYDTSIRLRETGALGMAMSLAVLADFSERKTMPSNLETVLAAVQTRGLIPPGVSFVNGRLQSALSVFSIRYNSQPLAFEILSSPKQSADAQQSPSLMMRFPLASLDKRTITYFQSARTNQVQMPEPFAPIERVVAAGWTIEQWRGELLPKTADAARILADEKQLLSEAANK